MLDFLLPFYIWIKAFHIISVISWMAGMFYLPRLFVYHAEKATLGSDLDQTFRTMERKLLKVIMTPAMIASWIFGLLLIGLGAFDFGTIWAWEVGQCDCNERYAWLALGTAKGIRAGNE